MGTPFHAGSSNHSTCPGTVSPALVSPGHGPDMSAYPGCVLYTTVPGMGSRCNSPRPARVDTGSRIRGEGGAVGVPTCWIQNLFLPVWGLCCTQHHVAHVLDQLEQALDPVCGGRRGKKVHGPNLTHGAGSVPLSQTVNPSCATHLAQSDDSDTPDLDQWFSTSASSLRVRLPPSPPPKASVHSLLSTC